MIFDIKHNTFAIKRKRLLLNAIVFVFKRKIVRVKTQFTAFKSKIHCK